MPPARPAHSAPTARVREQLLEVLGPVVAATGYDLEDLSVTSAGRRSLVRVIVDGDHGVDLDAIADVSRAVSQALDAAEPAGAAFAGPYVLEVSSPGVDRPLTEPRHWRRASGRLVEVAVGDVTMVGRVLAADGDGVRLEVDGVARHVAWADLGRGRVQVEFNRTGSADDPGFDDEADESDDDEIDASGDGEE